MAIEDKFYEVVSEETLPSIKRLDDLFEYQTDTGMFIRKVSVSQSKAGDTVGSKGKNGYLLLSVDGKRYYAHRVALAMANKSWPVGPVDHKNGVRADNRLDNLREATLSVNAQSRANARCDSETGVIGVSRKRSKFSAKIGVSGVITYLGVFDTVLLASKAYIDAKRKLHCGCTI